MPDKSSLTLTIGSQKYSIDKYAATGAPPRRPLVVLVHGVDGLGGPSGTQIEKFAKQIADAGFLVFIPHYFDVDDGPDILPFGELLKRRVPRLASYAPRIGAAVDYALTQSDADSGRLGLIGFSLGGGLVLNYAESVPPTKIKAVIDFFGYIADPAIWRNASRLPPTLILHHKNDQFVKLAESSQPLLESLDKTAVPHEHQFYEDTNGAQQYHPFLPDGAADIDARSRSLKWLNTYL